MQIIICKMSGVGIERGLVLTNAANIRSWTAMIPRLIDNKKCEPSILDEYKTLRNKIENQLLPSRNRVVHGFWSMAHDELFGDAVPVSEEAKASLLTFSKGGEHMIKEDSMTPEEVLNISKDIRSALDDLIALARALIDASKVSRG
ncbi:hypothetical protein [Uliginosibacterium gangwonense]|uniref:hypothetical protein n=1 Tax=Uliginosibacterium gangwonense TaxID=392736 RepID=UPI0012F928B4|nr:hypothetical protein [Uliginosibacterium gangwonense]